MFGDRVAGLAAENVVQAGLGTAFIVQAQEGLEGIDNPPAREQVDRDVKLVLGWHIGRIAVPLKNPLVEQVDVLNEGNLELQAGARHGITDRFAELRDNRLLDFAHCINRTDRNEQRDNESRKNGYPLDHLHGRSAFWESAFWESPFCGSAFWASRFRNGKMLRVRSSTMILERTLGITSCSVSI